MQAEAPSEPWKAMLAGAQAGSQIAANRNQAKALNQRKYEFDVEQQRMAILDAARIKAVDQQLELGKITIKNHLLVQEEKIKADRAMSKVADLFGQHQLAGIAGTDASEARIWSTISNNPEFWVHPGAHEFSAKMGLARQAREKASQFEDQEMLRLAQIEALNARKTAELESKEKIAQGRSATDLEKARIAAEAKVKAAMLAAEKWKDHSRFAAFKDASKAISISIDPSTEPEKWSEAIRKAYNETLPRGEPNAWDTVPGATPAAPSLPAFDWTPEGIKEIK
jgi:hypothetical protein